jgi:hypothetical protein
MTTVIDLLKKNNQDYLIECIKNDENISKIQTCVIQDKIVMYVEFKNDIVSNIVSGKKRIIRFFANKYEKVSTPQ